MSESKGAVLAYPRLCIAYFCQFAIWGAWAGALGGYVEGILKFTGEQSGWLYSAIPLGAIIGPLFIGPIADRYFSAQKVISVLHLIGGLALLACGGLCLYDMQSFPALVGLMLLSGICFMPTVGLVNSVVFKHLRSPSMAPYVFVWGTIGWIAVTLFIAGLCGGADTPNFFFVAGGVSVFLALYAVTLPNTPPKGAPAPGEKSSGPGVLSLFKNFPFVVFVFCAFLASIPACNYLFPSQVPLLSERGYPSPVALTTINQFSEILFMLALPFCIPRLGLKNVVLIGMAGWAIRWLCFAEPYFAMALVGLLLHGFCYTFLYVASYMYAERVAPAHLKASAQSMMVFLLLGVGQVLGGQAYGLMSKTFPAKFTNMTVEGKYITTADGNPVPGIDATDSVRVPIPAWSAGEDSFFQYLDLAAQVNKLLNKEQKVSTARTVDLGKLLEGKPLTPETIAAVYKPEHEDGSGPLVHLMQDGVKLSQAAACCEAGEEKKLAAAVTVTVEYSKDCLTALCKEIAGKDDFSLTREDWLAAQARDWQMIYRIPAAYLAVFFVIFLLLGREPKETPETQ